MVQDHVGTRYKQNIVPTWSWTINMIPYRSLSGISSHLAYLQNNKYLDKRLANGLTQKHSLASILRTWNSMEENNSSMYATFALVWKKVYIYKNENK